jgi:hypothetical protein
MDIARQVQLALLGEVPPSLRFVYAHLDSDTLHFHAVFSEGATDDEIECAHVALSEVLASCPFGTKVNERIEKNSSLPWKINGGKNLMFLRHGELSAS